MIEKIFSFGSDNTLVGVVTSPAYEQNIQPAVIILNAGLIHRVGPHRLNVDLARRLSSLGFFVLRVDLYGIGDSVSRKSDKSFHERAAEDIGASMDFLQDVYGFKRFVLIGLCAGADNAHVVAVEDHRVCGVVFLDAYGYSTLGFKLRDCGGPTMVSPIKWSKFFLKKLFRLPERRVNYKEQWGRNWPLKEKAERDIKALIMRKTDLLYVYTGGADQYYNYRGQFRDMFKWLKFEGRIAVEYHKNADHTFTTMKCREYLITNISGWMNKKYIHHN